MVRNLHLELGVTGKEGTGKAAISLKTNVLVTPGRMPVVGVASAEEAWSTFVVQVTGRLVEQTAPKK